MSLGIEEAVQERLDLAQAALQGVLGHPITLVDGYRSAELPVDSSGEMSPFMFFRVVGARPSAWALGQAGSLAESGFVQISVYVPNERGGEAARAAGNAVRDLFPRLTVLGQTRVIQPSWAAAALDESPYNHVPVTVPWVAHPREGDR